MKTLTIKQLFGSSTKRVRILVASIVASLALITGMYYLAVVSPSSAKAFSGVGAGSLSDPYQIYNCTQLQEMSNARSSNFILVADIDCNDTINWNGGQGFVPVLFTGSFDGRNHSITGLYINRPTTYAVGLFDYTGDAAFIKNLRLLNGEFTTGQVAMTGQRNVGALAAELRSPTIVTNVHSELNVRNDPQDGVGGYVGGLVGLNRSIIQDSSSSGNVDMGTTGTTGRYVTAGGLVGIMDNYEGANSKIDNSFATGKVSTGSNSPSSYSSGICGGLLGQAQTGTDRTVMHSYSTGEVSCEMNNGIVGGLIGRVDSVGSVDTDPVIEHNFTTSLVTDPGLDPFSRGGLIGYVPGIPAGDTIELGTNYYDVTRTTLSTCSTETSKSCNGVNPNSSDPDFFQDPYNALLNNWDQVKIWTIEGALPIHKIMAVSADAPSNVNVIRNGSDFEITWDAPIEADGRSKNIADYQVFYKDNVNNGNWSSQQDNYGLTNTATITGLTIPGSYSFEVRARNTDKDGNYMNGLFSAPYSIATGMPETAPQNVTGTGRAKSVVLNWSEVPTATTYKIQYRATGDTEWKQANTAEVNNLSGVVYGLEEQFAYQFQVQAFNNAGAGPWSETIDLTTTTPVSRTISNCQQLQDMRDDLEANYTITNDIDCSTLASTPVVGVFEPVGNGVAVFNGSLNGNNFKISNLTINYTIENDNSKYIGAGLFGVVAGATLQNIVIEDAVISGTYTLPTTIDANGNGVPDPPGSIAIDPNNPSIPSGGNLGLGAQEAGLSAQTFSRFATGGIAGIVAGWGTYSNLKVNDTVITGPISGGVFGSVYPVALIESTIIAPEEGDGIMLLDNLSSSGALYGFVSGGIAGIGVSSLTDFSAQPGQLVIRNSSSSMSVDANMGGGIIGSGLSLSALLPVVATAGGSSENLISSVDTALNTQAIKIQNSSASGAVSTCTAPSELRFGALGGIIGAGFGIDITDSHATGKVSVCSDTSDSLGEFYGGTMGGLSGALLASSINNSYATGDVEAIYNTSEENQVGGSFIGINGGLVGVMANFADQSSSKLAINNSYATGDVSLTGTNGLAAIDGGLIGLFVGSGTIKNSHATGSITNTLPSRNVLSFSLSGGLVGAGIGVDGPYILSVGIQNPEAATYGIRIDNSYSEGSVTVNKQGRGQHVAISGGMAGVLLGRVDVTNAYAKGDVKSLIKDKLDVFVGDEATLNGFDAISENDTGVNIAGGLTGIAWGVDGQQILDKLAGKSDSTPKPGILIDNTHASGNVSGIIAGGLIGSAELSVKINKSYSEGDTRGTIVGGLVGEAGALTSAASVFVGVASGSASNVAGPGDFVTQTGNLLTSQDTILGAILDQIGDAIMPIEISNTYTTGAVTGVRPEVAISGNYFTPAIDGLYVSVPTIAGGIAGIYAAPGGTLANSYSSGAIIIPSVPSTPARKPNVVQPPTIPSLAGGIAGAYLAFPKVNFDVIAEQATLTAGEYDINDIFDKPSEVKNVFSASTLSIQNDTVSGGAAGVFLSPVSIASDIIQFNADDSKLYSVENVYYDRAKINVARCDGPENIPELVYGIANTAYFPGSEDENTLDPVFTDPQRESEAKENITPYAEIIKTNATCTGVNQNNVQPDYFKNNKTNGPLTAWNFDSVWVVRNGDYPKFVAGVSTTTPGGVPATNGTTPSTPKTPSTGVTTPTSPSTDTTPTVGILRKQIAKFGRVSDERENVKGLKTYLANVPVFVARSIPYSLILLLLLVATLYSWQALRQYRQLSAYHKNIMRILTTKESVDNYLAITTHYLNTPVAVMSGSVELLLSLKKITAARADALTNKIKKFSRASEQLLVANQVSGAQSANDEKILKHDQTNPLFVKEVWIPAVIALVLIVIANALFIYAEVFNTSPFRIGIEIGLFMLSVLLIALAYRYREYLESSKLLAKDQLRLESELYKKRETFIPEAAKVTSEHLESLQITGKSLEGIPEAKLFFNGLAMLEGINRGLVNLQKFAEFNSKPPLFDITTYARKSVEKYKVKANRKNVKIESKVDHGLVSRIQPEEIRQLVDSLLDNAVKFSNENTTVSLSIYRRFNKIVISVSDKGVGISEHKLPSLLKPFSRGTDSMQYNYEGAGLGLYANKIIVDKLGGSISITSKLGEGTTATVAIPAKTDAKENVPVLFMPDVTPA